MSHRYRTGYHEVGFGYPDAVMVCTLRRMEINGALFK